MAVAKRDAKRVRLVRLQLAADTEQYADHRLHLGLCRPAAARHRLLDMARRVFGHGQAARGRRRNRRPARLTEFERGVCITLHKRLFHRHRLRAVVVYHRAYALKNQF